MIKKILIAIICLIAIPFIAAIFIKKEYSCQRSIIINKPNQQVFEYVKHLQNMNNFSTWNMTDSAMTKTYSGTDGQVGFVYAWDSQIGNVGAGEQEIKSITEGKRIDCELRFKKPFVNTATCSFETTAIDSTHTTLSWNMSGNSHYPMNIMNLFMDKMIGGAFDESLTTLKSILEK
jgi:uncharacterized membrane protein